MGALPPQRPYSKFFVGSRYLCSLPFDGSYISASHTNRAPRIRPLLVRDPRTGAPAHSKYNSPSPIDLKHCKMYFGTGFIPTQPRAGSRVETEAATLQLPEDGPDSTAAHGPSKETEIDYRQPAIVFAGALSIWFFIWTISWIKEPLPSDGRERIFAVLAVASLVPACLLELFGVKAALQRRLDHMSLYTQASIAVKGIVVVVSAVRLLVVWVIGDTCPPGEVRCFGDYTSSIAIQSLALVVQALLCFLSTKFAISYRCQLVHPSERPKDIGLAERGQYVPLDEQGPPIPGRTKHIVLGDQDEDFEDEPLASPSSSTHSPPAYEAA